MSGRVSPLVLPELGPLLGRLIPPPGEKSAPEAALDGVRFELLSALFEKAAAARARLSSGDEPGARSALGAAAWLDAWERAVHSAVRTVLEEIERGLRSSAQGSRYPPKRLASALPDAEERRLLAARCSAAGAGLEEAVERLDDSACPWDLALRRAAGELEDAWERLLAVARTELELWGARAAEIRAWRRPWRPLVLAGTILLALATWLGLVLGGYLPVPSWLRPLTNWFWNL